MTPVAYGPLGLKPWEFGRLTVGEFRAMVEGYNWRSEQRNIFAARFVAPVINGCHSVKLKRPVTVESMLGYDPAKKSREAENRKKSGKQLRAELSGLLREMDPGR